MKYHVTVGEHTVEVELGEDGVVVDGERVDAELNRADGSSVLGLHVDARVHRLHGRRTGKGTWRLRLDGMSHHVEVLDERTRAIRELAGPAASAAGPKPIKAPMPGKVVKVEVAEGDTVEKGQGVVIVEAMKMENELKADGAGRVRRLHVREGDAVEKDQLLVDLEPLEEAE